MIFFPIFRYCHIVIKKCNTNIFRKEILQVSSQFIHCYLTNIWNIEYLNIFCKNWRSLKRVLIANGMLNQVCTYEWTKNILISINGRSAFLSISYIAFFVDKCCSLLVSWLLRTVTFSRHTSSKAGFFLMILSLPMFIQFFCLVYLWSPRSLFLYSCSLFALSVYCCLCLLFGFI